MVGQPSWPAEVAPTLNQSNRGTGAPGYSDQEIFSQGAGNLVPQPVVSIQGAATRINPTSGPDGIGVSQLGVAYTLEARSEVQAVAQPVPYDLFQITAPVNRQNRKPGDPCHTLARDNAAHAAVAHAMTVRRLTPRECERLQAFPDDYTLIPWRNKPAADCPDGPRYKAIGNSMACNCMAWIGERIAAVEARHD